MTDSVLAEFQLLGQNSVNTAWNGTGIQLLVGQSAQMPQTPNGTLVFGWFNMTLQNNAGELSLSSGGGSPSFLPAPALAARPSILLNNWAANNLNVTNISPNPNTPVWISAYGPGVPGQFPAPLNVGTAVRIGTTQSVQGPTNPQTMRLVLTVSSPTLGIFAVVGGPPNASGSNGYVMSVNDAQNSGPGTGVTAPVGYYSTAVGNTATFVFNWQGATIYVVNMSSSSTTVGQVLLQAL
jgi:hypothetical protein